MRNIGIAKAMCSVSVAIMLVAGCATIPTQAPSGAIQADLAFPPKGATWVKRTDGVTTTVVSEGEGTYHGKPVMRFSNGTTSTVIDKESGNWIADLRDGEELKGASPHIGIFSWPLFVGKSWTARFAYEDHVNRMIFNNVVAYWTVEAYENVQVPAGTFKAFRLQSSPGQTDATATTLWYSPDMKITVKVIFERLSNHYLGTGRFVTELMEYRAP